MTSTFLDSQSLGGFVRTDKSILFRNLGTDNLKVKCLEFTNIGAIDVSLSVYQTGNISQSYQICKLILLPGWTKVFKEERIISPNDGFEAIASIADVVSWRVNGE